PANHIAAVVQLIPMDALDTADVSRVSSRMGDSYTRMHGTPYVLRRGWLNAPSRLPCVPPPWGSLEAIDLKTGARAWSVPLGDPSAMKSDLAQLPKPPTGTPNLGGPIITASGIVFIGATMD